MKKKETMRARLGTAGRLAGGLLAGLLAMTAARANETTWIGPAAGGAWHDVQNWDNGVPTADSTVHIAVEGDMTIAPAAQQNATLLRLRATGEGTLTIPHTGNGLFFGKDPDGRCGVDISEDVVCVVLTTFQSASLNLLPHFVKVGAGTLALGDGTTRHGFGRNNGWKFAGVDIAAGTLRIHYLSHTDAFDPGKPAILHIGPGATLDVQALNWLVNWGRLDVAAGGLVNLNGKQDLIGGLSGAGVVSNVNELTCSLQDGPYLFTGRIYGTSRILLQPHIPEASSNSTAKVACTVEQGRFIVGPEALANINTVLIPDEAVDYPQALQFAPGYPEGTVFDAKKITYPDALALCLEDAEGRPVTVRADIRATGTARARRTSGSGTLVHASETLYTTNTLLANTGALVATGAGTTLQLGDGRDAAADAVVAAREIRLADGGTLAANNVAPFALPRVAGSGTVNFLSASDGPGGNTLTFDDLSLTNGTLAAARPFPQFVVNGGISTNVTFNPNGATGAVLTVHGGFLHVSGGAMSGGAQCAFHQTGGHIVTEKPLSGYHDVAWQSTPSNNAIFYHMSGGVVESYTLANYGRGLGADLSGTAYMKLRLGAKVYDYHRLSSDGNSFQIKIADDAVLDVDSLNIATGEDPCEPHGYHGYLWLNGGTLLVGGDIYFPYDEKRFPNGFDGRVYFNGGLLKSTRKTSTTWFHPSAMTGYIGAGGLRLETDLDQTTLNTLSFNMPLVHDPACGDAPDGGIVKTGRGCLLTRGDATYTGPTRVTGGAIREDGHATAAPFGTASVELDDAGLYVSAAAAYTVASAEDATLAYDGLASLGAYGSGAAGASLTVGPLVRRNRGVLLLGSPSAKTFPGETATIQTTGPMPLSAGGLPAQPIFAYAEAEGLFPAFAFLTYDAARGFVRAACTDDPATAGADGLVQIASTPRTLTADAQIAGLDLRYRNGNSGARGLVVGAGRTLKIGNDAGYAPILLNGTRGNSSTPHQSIEGGTLDFGAAEGLVLSGQNANYGVWRANRITSAMTGSGGMTFAGGISEKCRMDLELHGANTWTGGTVIESLCVKPMAQGALADGPVTVHGSAGMGGGIWIPAESTLAELPNALTLAGRGCYTACHFARSGTPREGDYGALCADRSVTVSGAVALADDTLVRVRNSTAALTFTGGLSGAGHLTVAGNGTVRPGAGNTYTGGTRIEGVVECDAPDALGTGPVEIAQGAQLRFTNTQPLVFPNDVSGTGEIVFAGTAPVTFAGAGSFSGTVHGSGALAGAAVSFVKDDPGVAWLTAANTYGGETRVNAGTLVLGLPPTAETLPFAAAATAHFDASAAGTVTTETHDGETYVTDVRDADGRSLSWSNADAEGDQSALPRFRPGEINGRDTLFFDGSRDRLASSVPVGVQTVFAVFRVPAGSHPVGWNCTGFFGVSNADSGLRLNGGRTFSLDSWARFGEAWINGVRSRTFAADTVCVAAFTLNESITQKTAVGNYWGDSRYDRTWWGDIAEIVCYDRTFNADERGEVERHLAAKWGVALPEVPVLVNVIPATSAVTVAAGATIELAGSDQAFASLAGAGTVQNGAARRSAVTLGTGALADFTGTLTGNLTLRVVGTVTLNPAVVRVAPTVDLILTAGAFLDLNGGTLTVRNVSGTGWVRNGTLIVLGEDNRRNPATILIFR